MNHSIIKLALIQKILDTNDPLLLRQIADLLSDKAMVSESQITYKTKSQEPLRIEDLSPEFQESIRRGLADVEAGRVHDHEDEEKYWKQWFKEN